MLTGIKVSLLASKYVFYRPEHELNGDPLKWNSKVFGMQRDEINQQIELKD